MKPIDILVQKINEQITGKELMFGVSAPIKTSVLTKENAYKTVSLVGNEEFFLQAVRSGANDRLIFEFIPSDSRPYKQVEFTEKTVFEAVGDSMYGLLLRAVEAPEGTEWMKARAKFLRDIEKSQTEKARKAVEDAERKEQAAYGDNPLWGAF